MPETTPRTIWCLFETDKWNGGRTLRNWWSTKPSLEMLAGGPFVQDSVEHHRAIELHDGERYVDELCEVTRWLEEVVEGVRYDGDYPDWEASRQAQAAG